MAQVWKDYPQYPLNSVGAKGAHGFIGTERIFFTGATGLVGTAYGIPGVTATRVSTGLYKINHPPAKMANIFPSVNAPTGPMYMANIDAATSNAYSGVAYLHIGRQQTTKWITTGSMPSTYVQPYNPVSGTMIDLLFVVSPTTEVSSY